MGYDESGPFDALPFDRLRVCRQGGRVASGPGEGAHGVVKRPPEDLRVAVDGVAAKADALVAALVPLGPALVAFFDDEAGEIGTRQLPPPCSIMRCPRASSRSSRSTFRAARICSRVHEGCVWGGRGGLVLGDIELPPSMGLHEHAVDLFQIDGAGLIADRFDERRYAEIFCAPQQAFAGAHNEGERFGGEGVVAEPARSISPRINRRTGEESEFNSDANRDEIPLTSMHHTMTCDRWRLGFTAHASAVVEPDLRAGFAARVGTQRARRSRSTSDTVHLVCAVTGSSRFLVLLSMGWDQDV